MTLLRPHEVVKMKPDPCDAAKAGLKPAATTTLTGSIFTATVT